MLTLDLIGYSDAELKQLIAEHCAQLGAVTDVTIYRAAAPHARPLALVKMAGAEEVSRLAATFGDATLGNAVLIQLQQEARVPSFLRRF
jgi:hypothetical protein